MFTRKILSKRKARTNYIYIAAILAVIVIGALGYQLFLAPKPAPPEDQTPPENGGTTPVEDIPDEPEIPEFSITIIGLGGEQYVMSADDVANITVVEMDGGLKTSAGSIRAIGNYTAVPLSKVCDLVGGISSENSLRVTAADDYAMIFTWEELEGNFITFDAATGDETPNEGGLIPALAFMYNGEPLDPNDGPIRLVVLGEEGLITEGHFWIKQVVKIEILPAVREWTLSLEGARNETMDRATFESGANCPDSLPNHKGVYEDSEGKIWTGIPLWLLVGRVDDEVHHTVNAYNRDLADSNAYTINVVAGDGYSVTLNSSYVKMNENILLANELDGAPLPEPYWPLRLVGSDMAKSQMVRNIAKIQLNFTAGEEGGEEEPVIDWGPDWSLTLNGTLIEVMDRDTFIEGADCEYANHSYSWTDGEGQVWTGIPLWYLVGRVDDEVDHGENAFNRTLAEQGYTVRVIASDGYSKDFESSLVMLNNDVILAHMMDGGPLPEKYLPLRIVGPELTSGQMIRNVVEIRLIFPG